MKTETIRALRGFIRGPGQKPAAPGDVLDVPVADAAVLVGAHKAERYVRPAPPVVTEPEPKSSAKAPSKGL
jgi:hypothetical protein